VSFVFTCRSCLLTCETREETCLSKGSNSAGAAERQEESALTYALRVVRVSLGMH